MFNNKLNVFLFDIPQQNLCLFFILFVQTYICEQNNYYIQNKITHFVLDTKHNIFAFKIQRKCGGVMLSCVLILTLMCLIKIKI